MASEKQIAANTRNAQRSTGPTSAAGKDRSGGNALVHGGYATTARAIPAGTLAEDQTEIDRFISAVRKELKTRTTIENELATRIAVLLLRLRRTAHLELLALDGVQPASALDIVGLASRIDQRTGSQLRMALDDYYKVRDRPRGLFQELADDLRALGSAEPLAREDDSQPHGSIP